MCVVYNFPAKVESVELDESKAFPRKFGGPNSCQVIISETQMRIFLEEFNFLLLRVGGATFVDCLLTASHLLLAVICFSLGYRTHQTIALSVNCQE
jgi:hypothetical protein